jgi:hypothetical protein
MTEYYRGTKEDIEAYHNALHAQPELPISLPNGYRMDNWAVPRECLDGLWCYPRPSDDRLLAYVDQARIDAFREAYVEGKLSIEEFNKDWFDTADELL